ncbi:MAG: hypothetical protein KDA66_16415 [Planctomycetaceae bacterium]|nr:hypothetical protein [Planctomycetaceae bacterium]
MHSPTPDRTLRPLWLVLPPALLCMLDFGITLYGQSASYWSGNYGAVNELSPSFARYLTIHPLAFVGAGVLWIALFSTLIALLPEILALTVSIAVVIGHMGGTATWLAYRFNNYQACNALFLVTAFVVVLSFKRGQSNDGSSAFDWKRTGLPAWTRWAVVAALIALPIWWFLIPH